MNIPKDVLRFEILLYLSLALDALSSAFLGPAAIDLTDDMLPVVNLTAAFFIALGVLLVWLAARRRKNWARWVLVVFFGLSVVAYIDIVRSSGVEFRTVVDTLSLVLVAAGLYAGFTSDARVWFRSSRP